MIKNKIKNLDLSATLKINEISKNLENDGREVIRFGFETGDVITEFKVENLDRPNKSIIYPFSLMLLFIFGYLNYRRKE
jgi:hypothetical protein